MIDSTAPVATIWRNGEPVYDRGDTVCVIGAGGSGLAAIKNLKERGFEVDCYERETGVGGAWNWRHDRSPVYASAHLVSSRVTTQYPDFPMPDDWPDYPHHAQVLAYFERYAEHFELREHIWFGTEVVRVLPADDPAGGPPRWDVTIRGKGGALPRTMRYAAVIVANGHSWSPRTPEYEGLSDFKGKVIHASAYQDASQLRGRKVLVVGGGNAGCDIAVEAAGVATRCWHSTSRGHWYVPKYLLGRPADQANIKAQAMRLPLWLRRWLMVRLLRLTIGDLARFGLRAPAAKALRTHPTVDSQHAYHVGHGMITPVPDIARFGRSDITCTDGQVVDPDVVVLATGYLPRFEFLGPELLDIDDVGQPQLRWHLFAPDRPTLAVVGLLRPDAGLFPSVHWQSVLVAAWLRALELAPERANEFWKRHRDADAGHPQPAGVPDTDQRWLEVNHVAYLSTLERALNELEAIK